MKLDKSKTICPWCNIPSQIVWVHGHGQCSSCGVNIDDCCRGEKCDNLLKPEKDEEENTD